MSSHLIFDLAEAKRAVSTFDNAEGRPAPEFKIALLRNYSAEFIQPFLRFYFNRAGLRCNLQLGGFNTVEQDVLSGEAIADARLIVLSLTLDELEPDWQFGRFSPAEIANRITGVVELINGKSPAPVLINTVLRPVLADEGAAQAASEGSIARRIAEVNDHLARYAATNHKCLLVDWERLVMLLGAEKALDRRLQYLASAPFKHPFLSAYAYEIFRVARLLTGAGKKCVILDCDNTLWGGVVGEAGIAGIALDRNTYPGRAYYDFQKNIVRLSERGIMVALCSKNNLEDVTAVLEQHPHCLLRPAHLVAMRVNWEDKERNIAAIVEDLNIAMDAVVFIDDNPVECARIASFLPDLTVVQVPEQLSDLPLLLEREGLFDQLSVTQEDLARTQLYREEGRRKQTAARFATAEEFLASLDMVARIKRASTEEVPRVAQLTQKTNQFNLTTRRYSEGQIADMIGSQDWAVFTLSPRDSFGDLGLSGVLIVHRREDGYWIDSMLMSCRILGRELERQFVTTCVERLDVDWGPGIWHAEYLPTKKNSQVEAFWPAFGFTEEMKSDAGVRYAVARADLSLPDFSFIRVEE